MKCFCQQDLAVTHACAGWMFPDLMSFVPYKGLKFEAYSS